MKTTLYQELGCHQVCLSFSITLLSSCILHLLSLFKLISLKEDTDTCMSPVFHLVIPITTKPENFENSKGKSLLDLNLFLNQSTMNRELESGKDIEVPSENKGCPCGTSGKEFLCQCRRCTRHRFDPWTRKIPWKKAWQPMPVFLLGESRGPRNLAGYSP